jgi:hypothetical protein
LRITQMGAYVLHRLERMFVTTTLSL